MFEETLLTFPCQFPIKILGRFDTAFETEAIAIIRKHAPDLSDDAIKLTLSKQNKYSALTVTITAQSKAQLDAIYAELSKHELVVMVL